MYRLYTIYTNFKKKIKKIYCPMTATYIDMSDIFFGNLSQLPIFRLSVCVQVQLLGHFLPLSHFVYDEIISLNDSTPSGEME